VVRLSSTKSKAAPAGSGAVKVDCQVRANIAESSRELEQEELDELCRQLERREEERVRQTLALLQEWNADCAGICRRMGMKNPGAWAGKDWEEIFPSLSAEIRVHAKIEGGVL